MSDAGILQLTPIEGHRERRSYVSVKTARVPRTPRSPSTPTTPFAHPQGPAVRQGECVGVEQRDVQQVVVLPGVGVQPHLMEDEPRRHRTAVIVARQAVGLVAVVVSDNLVDALRTQVRASYPVVETGSEERRLVAHIVAATLKEQVQAPTEGLRTAAGINQTLHIMGDAKRVFSRERLIEERVPPRQIPGCHLRHRRVGDAWLVNLRVSPRHAVEPLPLFVARHDIAPHVIPLIVLAPQVTPVP